MDISRIELERDIYLEEVVYSADDIVGVLDGYSTEECVE